jgi:hypothetical protein
MHGVVNKAINRLITENYGEEDWNEIKKDSGADIDYFLSNESYDDSITFKLAGSASKVLNFSLKQVLTAFGEYWNLNTGQKQYGSLMQAGGNSAREFIINLPHFHSRVSLIYPKLTPPEFKIHEINDKVLAMYYFRICNGLTYLTDGLIQGIGKMFNENFEIKITQRKYHGSDHDLFELTWQNG